MNTDTYTNYVRYIEAKLRYYNFIQAFRSGNLELFFNAALDLAKDDITDILFTYTNDIDLQFKNAKQQLEKQDVVNDISFPDDDDYYDDFEYNDITHDT